MSYDYITTESLTDDEKVALGIIEVTSVPHISIIDENFNTAEEIIERYRSEMDVLLNEIYNMYKSLSLSAGYPKDISIELLWVTSAIVNQPFKAQIRLFFIVRAIEAEAETAVESVSLFTKLIKSTLSLQKYDYEDISYSQMMLLIRKIKNNSIRAIVKEEKVANLQNPIVPCCYSYDRLPLSNNDLSMMISSLIDYPECAVSMQLIPTVFEINETAEIDRITQALNTLSNGVTDQGLGNISFTLAEKHAEVYRYYSEHKSNSVFLFNVIIFGDDLAISNITSRVSSQISSGSQNSASLKTVELQCEDIDKDNNFYPLPWAINEILLYTDRDYNIWNTSNFSNALFRLPYIITSEEASEFFRLPIGSDRVSAGLKINESGKKNKTYTDDIINSGDITLGKLRSSPNGDTIGFPLKDLAKHMLVVGTPGSGKTTFSLSLLDRLWRNHKVPFLVIEPAKNEYRALLKIIPDLQIFTPGKNFISPFVFNPFVPPKNVKLETYKSTLKTAFAAAVSMSTPLDKIFEEAVNNCYSDFRWLDSYTSDNKGKIFNITDFIKCFQNTFDEIGYTGDAKNIGRAGVVRLNSLVNLFDNYFSIPIEDLLQKPTIIELAAIENSDQKALIIALLLLSILAYVNSNYIGEGGLKNVILLEEAHVLLDAESNGNQGDANPSAIAQGLVKRMLAEIRSYGVGIVIADQSPRKVSSDVVALTDMKVIFRLVEGADKQIIGDSTNMSETQIRRMAKLKPGEAFLFFNKLDEPEEIITPDYRLENNISITLSDASIRSLSKYWNNKADKLRPYPECCITPYCKTTCDFDRRLLAKEVARRIFVHNFKSNSEDIDDVKKVFAKISRLIMYELNDEEFTPELLSCVKVHLWRRIKYGTKIHITDSIIHNSICKK